MPATYNRYFKQQGIIPYWANEGRRIPCALKVSSNWAQGTVMGYLTAQSDVQTITMNATGGTFTITIISANGQSFTTPAQAYNVSLVNLQAALQALPNVGTNNMLVTGTAGSSYVLTCAGALANTFMQLYTTGTAGLTGSALATVVHTTIGIEAGTAATYASGNSDGSQTPVGILEFDCYTDINGNITEGDQVGGDQWGFTQPTTNLLVAGTFNYADLTGFDANAQTKLNARFVEGSISLGQGIVHIP